MQKIKICAITTVHPCFDVRIFHKECRTLADAGHDVILIAQHGKDETIDGIKIRALPKDKGRVHRMTVVVFKAFWRALKERADIYHFHDPELLPAGVMLRIITGAKVVYDVHEDYGKAILYKQYLPKAVARLLSRFTKTMERICSFFFEAVVTATDDILNNFSYHKNAVSVKNFPKLSSFPRASGDAAKDSSLINLVYTGGLAEVRGITEMVLALGLMPPDKKISLTLCGKFSSPATEDKVKKLKGFERVVHRGWVAPENIPGVLSNAYAGIVCLHPISNYLTAMPVKLFEYMAAGIPVVASDFPLWREIVEGNNCGICVDPLKPTEIARAILRLADHPEEAKQMGKNGRKAVEEKYNWKTEGKKLLSIYEKAVGD